MIYLSLAVTVASTSCDWRWSRSLFRWDRRRDSYRKQSIPGIRMSRELHQPKVWSRASPDEPPLKWWNAIVTPWVFCDSFVNFDVHVGWTESSMLHFFTLHIKNYHLYWVYRYLAPPPQHNWSVPDPKTIYYHDPTLIPELHARFHVTNLNYLLPVTWFITLLALNTHQGVSNNVRFVRILSILLL